MKNENWKINKPEGICYCPNRKKNEIIKQEEIEYHVLCGGKINEVV